MKQKSDGNWVIDSKIVEGQDVRVELPPYLLLNFMVKVFAKCVGGVEKVWELDPTEKVFWDALGYVLNCGMPDVDAVKQASKDNSVNLRVAEFRKWLPNTMLEFGKVVRGER